MFISTAESSTNFHTTNLNQLQNNNSNLYNQHVYSAPHQNLPNGQYTQNQLDSRYPTPHSFINRGSDVATKPATLNTGNLGNSQYHNNSNSGTSSDSDDSNNDSDSSSIESDAEKDNKENSLKQIVKPFRINLSSTKVR